MTAADEITLQGSLHRVGVVLLPAETALWMGRASVQADLRQMLLLLDLGSLGRSYKRIFGWLSLVLDSEALWERLCCEPRAAATSARLGTLWSAP